MHTAAAAAAAVYQRNSKGGRKLRKAIISYHSSNAASVGYSYDTTKYEGCSAFESTHKQVSTTQFVVLTADVPGILEQTSKPASQALIKQADKTCCADLHCTLLYNGSSSSYMSATMVMPSEGATTVSAWVLVMATVSMPTMAAMISDRPMLFLLVLEIIAALLQALLLLLTAAACLLLAACC